MDEEKLRHYRRIVFVILVAAFLIRAILVLSGGQYYWPDENRYNKSQAVVAALKVGDIHGALDVINSADHFLFKVIGVFPAMMQAIFSPSPKIPALFFSMFSVACLWLMWGIALRLGANGRVALLVVILLALCSTFTYYSRHLLPYDMAMAFGLLSIFMGLRTPSRAFDSVQCGFFSAACFLTYNGYWVLSGFALLTHTLQLPRTPVHCTKRALIAGASFVAPLVAILGASAMAGGDLLHQFVRFSNTVKQGLYSEGWSLPFSFLWHSEHFLVLLWAVALVSSFRAVAVASRNKALIFSLSGIVFIYGMLVIFSVFLEKFVVYGRLVRQLVPFCCILTALFLEKLWTSAVKRRFIVIVILAMAVCQAAWNFKPFFEQMFPSDFRRLYFRARVSNGTGKYIVLFAHHIYPVPVPAKDVGRTLIRKRHPLQFLPYQYEGYTPDQRARFRSTDISMRIILKEIP